MNMKKMLEKFIDKINNMSEKKEINNLTNNLNESNSNSKMKISTLSNLLDSINNDANDSGNDTGHSSDASSTSGEDFDNLIAAMTLFDINKDLNNDVKGNSDTDKIKSSNKSVEFNEKKLDLVKNDFDSVVRKDDSKQSKTPNTKKIYFKLKKSAKSKNKEKENSECVSKITANSDEANKNVNRLCEELSSVTISKEKKAHSDVKSTEDKKKPEDSDEEKTTNKKSKSKDPIFIERGPIIGKTLNSTRKKPYPNEIKPISNHHIGFSGGELIVNESFNINNVTIDNKIEIRLSAPQIDNQTINICSNTANLHNQIFVNTNNDETEVQPLQNNNCNTTNGIDELFDDLIDVLREDLIPESENSVVEDENILNIMNYLASDNNVNSPEFTPTCSSNEVSPNPNRNLNCLTSNYGFYERENNIFQYSPGPGIMSPPDSIENAQFYEPLSNESSPSTSNDWNESLSNNGSPSLPATDETTVFFGNSIQMADSSIVNNNYSSSPETQSIGFNPNSHLHPQTYNSNTTQLLNNYPGMNIVLACETNNSSGDAFVPLRENSLQNQGAYIDDDFRTNNQLIMSNYSTAMKTVKISPIRSLPIAPIQKPRCCTDNRISASENMIQMFKRLDDNMQKMMCKEVHKIDENQLMEYFDGQLSNWNKVGSQFPRTHLLHVTCKRLLMHSNTMQKFLEIYCNGHTVLDRVILTCWQTPLVVKYLAECMIKALNYTQKDLSFLDNNKHDNSGSTLLHIAAKQGENYAMSLASLLSLNEQYGKQIFNVNRLNNEGYTPLHIACARHLPVTPVSSCPCLLTAHVLLEHGRADPNLKERHSGNTALHIAISANACAPSLVKLLLKYRAKLSIKNYGEKTPLDLIRVQNRKDPNIKLVIDILKKSKINTY